MVLENEEKAAHTDDSFRFENLNWGIWLYIDGREKDQLTGKKGLASPGQGAERWYDPVRTSVKGVPQDAYTYERTSGRGNA